MWEDTPWLTGQRLKDFGGHGCKGMLPNMYADANSVRSVSP